MVKIESDDRQTGISHRITPVDRIVLVSFGAAFLILGILTVTWPFRVSCGLRDCVPYIAVTGLLCCLFGAGFAGAGFVALLLARGGDHGVRFDWLSRTVTNTYTGVDGRVHADIRPFSRSGPRRL